MATISCKNIIKNFGNVEVLKNIGLDIADGEFVVFVGPSGCGKTTLLRIIAGLEEATQGDLFIGETRVNDVAPKHRNIAMVFQNYAIYPHMNVAENISFGMKVRGNTKAEMKAAVDKAAAILGLEDLLARKPKQLSGGQRQRVAMGRAIVRDPSVFLMDEPLSNLDAKLRNQMRVEIKNLQRRLKTTTIYVTHDQVEAMTLADRIAIMKDGKIQQFGTPDELYTKPCNRFVASFFGAPQMNFINAKRASNDKLVLTNECEISIPAQHRPALEKYSRFQIGIRPECLSINQDAKSMARQKSIFWQSTVNLCEALGSETILHIKNSQDDLQAKVDRKVKIAEGSNAYIGFDIEDIYFFCEDTGDCIANAINA